MARNVTEEVFEKMWEWHADYENQLYKIFSDQRMIVARIREWPFLLEVCLFQVEESMPFGKLTWKWMFTKLYREFLENQL